MIATTKDPASDSRHLLIGALLVLIGAFGFSSKAVLIKLAYRYGAQVDAITLMTLRMTMALPFFVLAGIVAARRANAVALESRDKLAILALGFLGYYLASFFDFSGLAYISAGLERVILYLYPTLVVVINAFMQRRAANRHEMTALVLSYAGILLVFIADIGNDQANLLLGSALVFASAVSFALFTIGSGHLIQRIGAVRFSAYSMVVACLLTTIHYGLAHELRSVTLPMEIYGLGLLLAIFCTVIPSFLISAGIGHIGVSKATLISSAGPIATIILAAILLNETISAIQLIGTGLVLAGVLSVTRGR